MTLDEIFEKYTDEQYILRSSKPAYMSPVTVGWAKGLKAWGNEESRKIGFWIPQFMIEDAQANDWELKL